MPRLMTEEEVTNSECWHRPAPKFHYYIVYSEYKLRVPFNTRPNL